MNGEIPISLNQEEEWTESLQDFLLIDQDDFLENAIIVNFSAEIVEIEWLTDLVSELAWNWHGLELKIHGCSTVDIAELEVAFSHAGISVEEAPCSVLVFWEFLGIWEAWDVLAVIVKDVDGLLLEQFGDFLVLVDHVSQVSLLEVGVEGSVSESGVTKEPRHQSEDLETEGDVPALVEEE